MNKKNNIKEKIKKIKTVDENIVKKNIDIRLYIVIVLGAIIVSFIIICLYGYLFIGDKTQSEEVINSQESETTSTEDQYVEPTFSKVSLSYENGVSKLVTKVENKGKKIEDLNFYIKVINSDDIVLIETKGYAGVIEKDESIEVTSYFPIDITMSKDIIYSLE